MAQALIPLERRADRNNSNAAFTKKPLRNEIEWANFQRHLSQSFPGTSADLPFSKNRIKSGVRIKSALWPASIYGILQKSLQACLAQLFIIPLVVHFSITVLVISRVRNSIGQAIDQAG
ncbi:hypothetical protein PCASD_04161 [Puccinia coronata f. sp. avenae]|uniref:Uncharacterized protein n=1 Tax=Puccinia coronata f. sp. avenae TaxID=200324 RepID=A0A2N5V848_9BASI|nr:hypothetical protein PCASD_04161 [Puccinia coronata f. sp. avenae]